MNAITELPQSDYIPEVVMDYARGVLNMTLPSEIDSNETQELVLNVLDSCKAVQKKIVEAMAPYVKDAHEYHKQLKSVEKSAVEPFELMVARCKALNNIYHLKIEAQKRKEQEEQKQQLAELAEKTGNKALADITPAVPESEEQKGRYATRWMFEITDPTQVNIEFMIPDEKKIRGVVTTMKESSIYLFGKGVRVYSVTDTRARS